MTDDGRGVIHRFEVPVDGQWHWIGGCSTPRYVACRRTDVVEFWAWVIPSMPERPYRVYGTGEPIEDVTDYIYQGTAIAPGGQLVWHLIQRPYARRDS
jgi:hypothetical protein